MMGALALAAALTFTVIIGLIGTIIPITLPEIFDYILPASILMSFIAIIIGLFLKVVGLFIGPERNDSQGGQRLYEETPRTNRLMESPALNSSITEHTTKSLEDRVAESADGPVSGRLSQKSRSTYIGLQFSVRMFVVPPLGGKAQEPDDSG